jgi:hypothetical protein
VFFFFFFGFLFRLEEVCGERLSRSWLFKSGPPVAMFFTTVSLSHIFHRKFVNSNSVNNASNL